MHFYYTHCAQRRLHFYNTYCAQRRVHFYSTYCVQRRVHFYVIYCAQRRVPFYNIYCAQRRVRFYNIYCAQRRILLLYLLRSVNPFKHNSQLGAILYFLLQLDFTIRLAYDYFNICFYLSVFFFSVIFRLFASIIYSGSRMDMFLSRLGSSNSGNMQPS